jgi:hypothetical protein
MMSYASDRIETAVVRLAAGEGRIRERLAHALTALTSVTPDDVPDGEVRKSFEELQTGLRATTGYGSGLTTRAAIDSLSEARAADFARQLLELGYLMRRTAQHAAT